MYTFYSASECGDTAPFSTTYLSLVIKEDLSVLRRIFWFMTKELPLSCGFTVKFKFRNCELKLNIYIYGMKGPGGWGRSRRF